MQILILSRKRSLYSTRQLAHAAKELGHVPRVIDPLHLSLFVDAEFPSIHYRKRRITPPDVVIPRIGTSITDFGLAAVEQFQMLGVPVVNSAHAIAQARDKFRCIQILAEHGFNTPRTVMVRTPANWRSAVKAVGGLPIVIKLIQGTQGIGVMLAETQEAVESVLDTLWCLGQSIIIQEFIAESRGRDIRAFVIKDRVVCAMRRQARVGEFRSNIHRGGEGTMCYLDQETCETAVGAAKTLGLQVAGVDMLESPTGPKIIECNASPGFEGIELATGINVAKEVILYALVTVKEYQEKNLSAQTRQILSV